MIKDTLMRGESSRVRQEIFVRWKAPAEGWVILNTDGAAKGNPGLTRVGGIIKGHRGEIHEIFALNCGRCSCTRAEWLAVMRGLVVAWNGGHKQVQLFIDSEVVVRSLVEPTNTSSPYFILFVSVRLSLFVLSGRLQLIIATGRPIEPLIG